MTEFQTSPLGLGMATVMRLPTFKAQLELIDAAFAAGIRHFDVAPSYGLGRAEGVLGRWLRSTGADITVATKVGLPPSRLARRISVIQGPLRRGLAASPRVRAWVRGRGSLATAPVSAPSGVAARESVCRSIAELGRPVDVLLLHEVAPDAIGVDLVENLVRLRDSGATAYLGASGPKDLAVAAAQRLGIDSVVIQAPVDLVAERGHPREAASSRTVRLRYGLMPRYLERLNDSLQTTDIAPRLETLMQRPVRTREDAADVLVVLVASRWPSDTLLLGSTRATNVQRVAQAVEPSRRPPADSLRSAWDLVGACLS